MHTQSPPQTTQHRRAGPAHFSTAFGALRQLSNNLRGARRPGPKHRAALALTEHKLAPKDVRQSTPGASPRPPATSLEPSDSPSLAFIPRKKSIGAAPGGHVRQSSSSVSSACSEELVHPELLTSQPLSNSSSRLPPCQAGPDSGEASDTDETAEAHDTRKADDTSEADESASSSESSSVDDWDPDEAERQKRLTREAAVSLPARQRALLKAFDDAVDKVRARLDSLYIDFSQGSPASEQSALYQAFACVLEKLASLKPAFADALPGFMNARKKALDLSAAIADFEERVCAMSMPRRQQLERLLATTPQGPAKQAIQLELDVLTKVFNDMRKHNAFRKAVLTPVPEAGVNFLKPAPVQQIELRPAVNWASMKLRLHQLVSRERTLSPGRAQVRQALHQELGDADLEDALLTLVGQFCAACQNTRTEIPFLLDLIAQSRLDLAKAKLLSVLRQGLNLECEGATANKLELSLQAPLDYIHVLLALLQDQAEGAQMFAEMAHRHQLTRSRLANSERMTLLFVMEAVGMEANGARVNSLVEFTRLYAAYGERLSMSGLPCSTGAKSAQDITAALQMAGVN